MKRIFSIFLSLILIFNFVFVSFSYAEIVPELEGVDINSNPTIDPIGGEGELGELNSLGTNQAGYEAFGLIAQLLGWLGSILSKVVMIPLSLILAIIPHIDEVIFNKGDWFRLSFFDVNPAGLAGKLTAPVSAIYNALRYLVTTVYIIILVYLAIRMMFSSIGRQKAHYKELFKHWLVGLLLIFSFHWIMAFIIWFSNTFVELLSGLSDSILEPKMNALQGLIGDISGFAIGEFYKDTPFSAFIVSRLASCAGGSAPLTIFIGVTFGVLVEVILFILLLGSTFSIILAYFKRLITIAILIVLFPIVALSYVFDKIGDRKAQTLSLWLKEFTVNVMMQPIHALILVFISILYSTSDNEVVTNFIINKDLFGAHILGAIMCIISLRLIPVAEEMLKKLFQINSSMGLGAEGIAGGMAKAGLALQGAKNFMGTAKKIGTGAFTAANVMRPIHKELKYNKKKAADEAKAALNSNASTLTQMKAAHQARRKVATDFKENKKDSLAYKQALNELHKLTGHKTLKGAYAHAASQLTAATFGVGTAITGAGKDRFLSEAATRATLGAGVVDGLVASGQGLVKFKNGDEEKSKSYDKVTEFLNNGKDLTGEQLKKIEIQFGMKENTLTNDMLNANNGNWRKQLAADSHAMANFARFSPGEIKNESLLKVTQYNKELEDIKNGLDPFTGEKLNPNDYQLNTTTYSTTMKRIDGLGHEIIAGSGNSKISVNDSYERNDNIQRKEQIQNNINKYVQEQEARIKETNSTYDSSILHANSNYNTMTEQANLNYNTSVEQANKDFATYASTHEHTSENSLLANQTKEQAIQEAKKVKEQAVQEAKKVKEQAIREAQENKERKIKEIDEETKTYRREQKEEMKKLDSYQKTSDEAFKNMFGTTPPIQNNDSFVHSDYNQSYQVNGFESPGPTIQNNDVFVAPIQQPIFNSSTTTKNDNSTIIPAEYNQSYQIDGFDSSGPVIQTNTVYTPNNNNLPEFEGFTFGSEPEEIKELTYIEKIIVNNNNFSIPSLNIKDRPYYGGNKDGTYTIKREKSGSLWTIVK